MLKKAERQQLLADLASEQANEVEYEKEIATYAACDPIALKEKLKRAGVAKTAANRWTGSQNKNIFWCPKTPLNQPKH